MLNIGFSELVLFGMIALVILGPDKLPTAVRTAGRWYARLRFMVSNLQQDIEKELQLSELREHMQQELDRIKAIEAQMQVQLNQMSGELAELNQISPCPSSAKITKAANNKLTATRYFAVKQHDQPIQPVPYTANCCLKHHTLSQPRHVYSPEIIPLALETA